MTASTMGAPGGRSTMRTRHLRRCAPIARSKTAGPAPTAPPNHTHPATSAQALMACATKGGAASFTSAMGLMPCVEAGAL